MEKFLMALKDLREPRAKLVADARAMFDTIKPDTPAAEAKESEDRSHPRRHFQSRLGSNLHRRSPRTRNLTSVRASRSMSGWDGPVASRSLAVRPRCLGCARGCRYPPLPSSTLDNAAAVIAADARAGLFGPVRLARPSACLGEISGGRINGGASPPFVRVKAEDSSLKNIRL